MRCLTLADALRECGAQCCFICRSGHGQLLDLISQRRYETIVLPVESDSFSLPTYPTHAAWLGTDWTTDAEQTKRALALQTVDWLVVDHYALDSRWEQALRPVCQRLMVIDDLADRPHSCDLLLDQNLGRTIQDYDDLLPHSARRLIGPEFALLRPEFAHWRQHSLARRAQPQLKHLLITMGGVDQGNASEQVLSALKSCELPVDLHITVAMGWHAPWLMQVQEQAAHMPWPTHVLDGVDNMAELMAESDLVIGAAGGTSWERCTLGVPCFMLVLAENQRTGAAALQQSGAAIVIEGIKNLPSLLQILGPSSNVDHLLKMSVAAAKVTDGSGASKVVASMLDNHV